MFKPYTKTINKEEYIETLSSVCEEISQIIESKVSIYTFGNNSLITERLSTSLRQIVDKGTSLERLIKKQILEAAYNAEKSGPNSTKLFLVYATKIIKEIIDNLSQDIPFPNIQKEMMERYDHFKDRLQEETKKATWEDVVDCVKSASRSELIANMVIEAVELAGLEGNIIPGGSANGKYSVELVTGYNFPVSTYPLFTEEDKGRWGRGEVRVLVVDGVIERASEIHKILSEAYETEKPILLVARGYGEEVIGTIASNKKLDICPIRIPWELESINYITDISKVCGSHIVSTMKGDLLTNISYGDLPIVEKVICTKENLNIFNSKTQKTVNDHVTDLMKRREDTHVEQMSEFISKRIKALNSQTVHIRLGSKTEQQKMKELESVDFALRIVKGVLERGTVYIDELGFKEKMPTISVLSAIFHGTSLSNSLCSIECAIMVD